MKTAAQMREVAETKNVKGLPSLIKSIEAYAKRGETSGWIYRSVTPEERKALTDLGYTVGDTQYDRGDILVPVSW